jgi:hypothetical protein
MRFHEEDLDAKNSSETVALKRFNGGVTDKLPYLKAKVESCRGELGKIALNEEKAALQIELIKALGGGYSDQKERSDADK